MHDMNMNGNAEEPANCFPQKRVFTGARVAAVHVAARMLADEAGGRTEEMRAGIDAMPQFDREAAMIGLIKIMEAIRQLYDGPDTFKDAAGHFTPDQHQAALFAVLMLNGDIKAGSGCCDQHYSDVLAAAVRLTTLTAQIIMGKQPDMAYRWGLLAEALAPAPEPLPRVPEARGYLPLA